MVGSLVKKIDIKWNPSHTSMISIHVTLLSNKNNGKTNWIHIKNDMSRYIH